MIDFAIRAALMSAIAIAFYLTRGFSSWIETFLMILAASLASQLLVLGLRKRGTTTTIVAIAGTMLVSIGALAFVIAHARHHGPLASRTVEEVLARPDDDAELQLHGYVELRSLKVTQTHAQPVFAFVLADKQHHRIAVRHTGVAPDTLKERAEVLARGHLTHAADGTLVFESTELSAKCPSTYQTKDGPVPASRFR